jgi:hypothetical protein
MSNAEITWVISVAVAWVPLVILVVALSAVLAMFGKFFERRMSYPQHWLTCLTALGIVAIVALPFFAVSSTVGLSRAWDGLAILLFVTAVGLLITIFARWKYRIDKTGRFGLGAKIMLSYVVPSSVLTGVAQLTHQFAIAQ